MRNTLYWKKTIGILSIIFGGLRLISGIIALSDLDTLENSLVDFPDGVFVLEIKNYISFCNTMLPTELITVLAILVLGIVLLCTEKRVPADMPATKSRDICYGILSALIIYLLLEWFIFNSMPSAISSSISTISIISSLGFAIVLIVFCLVGLTKNPKPQFDNTVSNHNDDYTVQASINKELSTPFDKEIADLKKQIEKRKLEKELEQINAEKQAEIEQLKKELNELE